MLCSRCGRTYRDSVPMYCECGAPLQPATERWDATVAMPQMDDAPFAKPDEATAAYTRQSRPTSAIWPAAPQDPTYAAYPTTGNLPPPPPAHLIKRQGRRPSLRLFGIALTLIGLAAVALLSAVALAQHRMASSAGPLAAGKTTPVTATKTAQATPTGTSGDLRQWAQSATCVVEGDTLHVIGSSGHLNGYLCDAPTPPMQSGTVQAQATFVQGGYSSAVGIAVRVNHDGDGVTADEVFLTQHGTLYIIQHIPGHTTTLTPSHTVASAAKGLGATNTIAVTTQGDLITVTVNGQVAAVVTDDGIPTTGTVALAVRGSGQEGAFSDFSLTSQTTGDLSVAPGA